LLKENFDNLPKDEVIDDLAGNIRDMTIEEIK
jgi:hypothetical protein